MDRPHGEIRVNSLLRVQLRNSMFPCAVSTLLRRRRLSREVSLLLLLLWVHGQRLTLFLDTAPGGKISLPNSGRSHLRREPRS